MAGRWRRKLLPWALIEPHLPPANQVARPRLPDLRALIRAIFYLLRTGCQWRLLRGAG